MFPTQFPELNNLIPDFVASHREILGHNMIGFYLQGSAAVGDMDEHSDVDFIVVTERNLNHIEMADLQKMHTDFFDRTAENQWAEHFEGSYFPIDVLQTFDQPETKLVYIDNGSSTLEMNTHCNTLVVRWCLREMGVTLAGPDPETLLDPIPIDQMKDEVKKVMFDWEGWIYDDMEMYSNRFFQTFIVLTYSRMLQTLATGQVFSKPAGVQWAVENLDEEWHDLITSAHAVRDDAAINVYTPADPAVLNRTLEFVTYANKIAETTMSQEQTHV